MDWSSNVRDLVSDAHDGVLGHVRDDLLAVMLTEFTAGRLKLDLVLDILYLVLIRII